MSMERVHWLREQATRLRRMANDLDDQARAVEQEVAGRPILRGRAIVDVALAVLLFEGGDGLHYRDLLVRVEDRSEHRVAGVDPAATLLAALHRDPRVRPCGRNRSGLWVAAD